MSDSLKHLAARASIWSAVEISARYGVQFVTMVVLARLLPPSSFGQIAMIVVFTSLASILVDSGFSAALVQHRSPSKDDEATVFLFSLGAGLALAGLLIAGAPLVADFYEQPPLTDLLRALALTLPFAALAAVPDAMLSRRLEFRSRAIAEALSSLLAAATAITLVFAGYGVWGLVCQAVIATATRALLLWVASGWRPRGNFSAASFRTLFRFGGFMLLSNLLDVASLRLQSLLIGRLFDSRTLGVYTIAQTTQQAPTSLIGSLLYRLGLPVFATVSHDQAKLRLAVRMSLQVSMFLFVPSMAGIALAADPLIEHLYGPQWLQAAPILSLLALGAIFWPMHVLNIAALNAQGRSDLVLRIEFIKKAFAVVLILLAATSGPLAIAGTALATSILSVIVNCYYSGKFLDYGLLPQMKDQAGTALGTSVAAAVGYACLHWTSRGILSTLLAVGAAGIVYLIVAVGLKLQAWEELKSFLASIRLVPPLSHTHDLPDEAASSIESNNRHV